MGLVRLTDDSGRHHYRIWNKTPYQTRTLNSIHLLGRPCKAICVVGLYHIYLFAAILIKLK